MPGNSLLVGVAIIAVTAGFVVILYDYFQTEMAVAQHRFAEASQETNMLCPAVSGPIQYVGADVDHDV
jgi:hypothetical protein